MPQNNELIQQLQRSNTQLKRISTVNSIDNITDENKSLVNNSYLLLTVPNVDNYIIKVNTLFTELYIYITEQLTSIIENQSSGNSTDLEVLKQSLITKINELSNQLGLQTNNLSSLQASFNSYKSLINSSYYTKDKINELLNNLQTEIINNMNEIINDNINESIIEDINCIKNELMSNNDTIFNNSRIDKIEKELKTIKNNVNITVDNIDKVIWENYSILNETNIPTYIINDTSVRFNINKGNVKVIYDDGTPTLNVNSLATYIISTGSISGNTITLDNSSSEGLQTIKVSYNNHLAKESSNDNIAMIQFNTIKTKYYYHFWLVDGNSLSLIFNGSTLNNDAINYAINSSFSCPMKSNTNYYAEQLIRDKFYNSDNSQDLSNQALYLIIPSTFVNLQNNINLKINNQSLKSNIFEINIIGLENTFVVQESAYNLEGYTKNINYSLIKISETINSGINLNI